MIDRVIRVVSTPEELKAYQELIFQVYCQELKWFSPDNYPKGRVEDEFDTQSRHFLVLDSQSGEIMAGMRLVRSSILGLPISTKFGGVKVPDLELITSRLGQEAKICDVEVSQVAACRKFRERGLNLTLEMVKIIYHYSQANSLGYMYFTIDMKYFLVAQANHIAFEPIGVPRFYQGSWVIPCIIFFKEMNKNLKKNKPQDFDYVINPDNLVGNFKDASLQEP